MHVEIHTDCLIRVRVVSLGSKDKYARKLGVAIERTDAGDDITIEDFESFPRDDDFASYETRTAGGEVVINYRVELADVLERKPEQLNKLQDDMFMEERALISKS